MNASPSFAKVCYHRHARSISFSLKFKGFKVRLQLTFFAVLIVNNEIQDYQVKNQDFTDELKSLQGLLVLKSQRLAFPLRLRSLLVSRLNTSSISLFNGRI